VVEARQSLIDWRRPIEGRRAVVLTGAFDPPTNAHTAILRAAAARLRRPGVLCPTRVVLARPAERLLSDADLMLALEAVADSEGFGLCVADGGTYLEVARDFDAAGVDAAFVIGSDKLPQLADPAHYADGAVGVDATFRDVRFIVVERSGTPAVAHRYEVLDAFADARSAAISATEVRRRVRRGQPVDSLVPPVVAQVLERYTAPG